MTRNGDSTMNEHLIGAWLSWLVTADRAPETLRVRRGSLEKFAADHDLLTATGEDIGAWLVSRSGGAASRRQHTLGLRSFYRYALATGVISADPMALIPTPRVYSARNYPVPEHVLSAALAEANVYTRLVLSLGGYAGLRRNEIACLHADDVTEAWLRITGKGRRVRTVPIHPMLRPQLAGLTGWIFPSPYRPGEHLHPSAIAEVVAKALGAPWTTHSLRRRFATQAYLARRDVSAVQHLLGHSSPASTSLYINIDGDSLASVVATIA